MSKADRRKLQVATVSDANPHQGRTVFQIAPWVVRHERDQSFIDVYSEAAGEWVTLLAVEDTAFVDAEPAADFMVRAVNAYDKNRALIGELVGTLRRCLASGSFELRMADSAELVIRKAEYLL